MYTFNPTHTPARSLFHTGTVLATRPSTGAWLSYGLGSENENLPAFVVLTPGGGGGGDISRTAFLPAEYQGIRFSDAEVEPEKMIPEPSQPLGGRRDSSAGNWMPIQALNRGYSERFGADAYLEGRIKSMEAAYRMQFEALDVFDIRKESEAIRARIRQLRRSPTVVCWRGGWRRKAFGTSTSITARGRFGTTTRTSTMR